MSRAFATVAVLAAVAPVLAHGPMRKELLKEPPPGTEVPVSPPPAPAEIGTRPRATGAGVTPTTGTRPLRVLAAEASAVVAAAVARTELYDEGRLALHRLRVRRVLRGRADAPAPAVVEIRGESRRPPLLVEGEHAVLIVRPSEPLSYLTTHLPEGERLTVCGGRDGVLRIATDAELEAVERALAEGAPIAAMAPAEAVRARRRLAFEELAGPSPRLAADAVVELRGLPTLAALTPAELEALARTLRDTRVDRATRIALTALVGERRLTEALPALVSAEIDAPAVLEAVLAARGAIGKPAGRAELAPYLASDDPAVRAAAVGALVRLDDPDAFGELGRRATADPDLSVRAAAVQALGETRRPEAVPVLARTFSASERELKQKSAQAMLRIGGGPVEDALVELALHGTTPETQAYAALVLIASVGRSHPAVGRIEAANPSPEVRDLLQHGLEFREAHAH